MAFGNGFRGTKGGSVQSAYTDQPGIAVPGMVAFASDNDLRDAVYVGQSGGIAAGRGVRFAAVSDDVSGQSPNVAAHLPAGSEVATAFAGIVLFDEAMQSDENGVPGWDAGRMARVIRAARSGGRIHVAARATITPGSSTVNWVIAVGTQTTYALGEFSPVALGGGNAGTSVALPNAAWVTKGAAGGTAIIELLGAAAEFGS